MANGIDGRGDVEDDDDDDDDDDGGDVKSLEELFNDDVRSLSDYESTGSFGSDI